MTLQEVRTMVSKRLKDAGIESFDYETWVFLDWKLGVSRMDYYMDATKEIDGEKVAALEKVLAERERRVPLQYLMHKCDFMGYEFYVDHRVLIPRQDTECLVEKTLEFLRMKSSPRVLDLCTGSGCIGISIKLLYPSSSVTLSDLSDGAIEIAQKNASDLHADVRILQGDLYEGLQHLPKEERTFDLIVSNPPYIPTKVVEGLMPEVRDFEPHMALDGSDDGLFFYREITKEATNYLRPDGILCYEIGAEQGKDVSDLLKNAGFCDVSVGKDLAGLDRIVSGRLS